MGSCILFNNYTSKQDSDHKRRIFGIKRPVNSIFPSGERTDDAIGMNSNANIIYSTTYSDGVSDNNYTYTTSILPNKNDFDNYYPGKGMVRETLSTGDVMVKIPKFGYKRYVHNNIEYIKIANEPIEEFEVHPAFLHNGENQDYIYVGAYEAFYDGNGTVSDIKTLYSLPGLTPIKTNSSTTFSTLRQYIGKKSSGSSSAVNGGGLLDISTLSAIQMLYLVEFASNDSVQELGNPVSTSIKDTGFSLNAPNSDSGSYKMLGSIPCTVYRGMENLGGNTSCFIDGFKRRTSSTFGHYICNTQNLYNSNNNFDNYNLLSSAISKKVTNERVSKIGYDGNYPGVLLPIESIVIADTDNESNNYYYCSNVSTTGTSESATFFALIWGGYHNYSGFGGIFYYNMVNKTYATESAGARIIYIPEF